MRTAVATAILVVAVVVAGCAGPDEPGGEVEGTDTTTFTENERGAHPDSPGNDTQNGTATGTQGDGNGTGEGGNGTQTTDVNATAVSDPVFVG